MVCYSAALPAFFFSDRVLYIYISPLHSYITTPSQRKNGEMASVEWRSVGRGGKGSENVRIERVGRVEVGCTEG